MTAACFLHCSNGKIKGERERERERERGGAYGGGGGGVVTAFEPSSIDNRLKFEEAVQNSSKVNLTGTMK